MVGREQELDNRPDYAGVPGAVAMPEDQGVQTVLGVQHVADPAVGGLKADTADTPVHRRGAVHQRVEVHRLVRAVKVAHPDVHDPGSHLAAVVTRARDTGAQLAQGLCGQCGHAAPSAPSGCRAGCPADAWVAARADTTCRNRARRSVRKAAVAGSGSATRRAGGASGPRMSLKLSSPAAWAP